MIEITVNGKALEIKRSGQNMQYTFQIAEIYDISAVAYGHTNLFKIPKTPNNTQIFQQLGMVGDTSQIPYQKVAATLKHHGFAIIRKGWLQVKETGQEYEIGIINGMIDFFKEIENKTMGVDLDLSDFSHSKNMSNVINSFTNEFYKYIVADYNGKNIGFYGEGDGQITGINIDYLIPCFSVRKLWDKIFETFGFTFNPEPLASFIDGLYITYPKPPQEDAEPVLLAEGNKTNWNRAPYQTWNGYKYVPNQEFWSNSTGDWNGWQFIVPATGGYIFEVTIEAYARYNTPVGGIFGNIQTSNVAKLFILKNGVELFSTTTNPLQAVTFSDIGSLSEGDVIELRLAAAPTVGDSTLIQIRHNSTNFKIYGTSLGEVSLMESFKDFQIRDFIKEILWRTALTPVIDVDSRNIDFVPLSQRLDFSNAVDWTDKYVQRLKESYDSGRYAQKNTFKLKHNNEADTRGDGYFFINNRNLKDEVTIVNSRLYAPETFKAQFTDSFGTTTIKTDTYKIWEKEPKTNEEGEIEIEYKGLNNRYYFLRYQTSFSTFMFVSEYLDTAQVGVFVPFAKNNDTLFDELVFKNWAGYSGVLNNFRAHNIELVLSINDILELDLTRPVFFKQEAQYYILNSLKWQEGKTCIGEFVRISKV